MASDKKKTENIITFVIVAFAVILSGLVILVKTGVIGPAEQTTTEPEVVYVSESTIVVKSEIDDEGNVKYYTALEWYNRPLHSSLHWYPTTTTTTKPTTEEETEIIEETSVVEMTDEEGNPVLNENGEPVTEIKTVTKKVPKGSTEQEKETTETTTETTSERTTKVVYITHPISKKPVKNLKGEPIVSGVLTEPEPETSVTESHSEDDSLSSTTKPVTTKPNTTKPVTTKPSTTKPSTTKATTKAEAPDSTKTAESVSTDSAVQQSPAAVSGNSGENN